ncbi:unnamed protein product [Rotaria sp. Silwood1]|nr:unnamed protein product [Rotaria sp. Silwood1]CAF1594278.1 unnamed protein product [Rotaria sp. Silwood1]CAF1594536.1 unnamed protein product [Rotaria sp. Silwood1]CAF3668020.1 unnamed protein product [Rotaria sp. Silwood1]
MSNSSPFGSGFPPPPSPPSPWWCNGCRRTNAGRRYQCKICKWGDTYDLCDRCINKAPALHPGHSFRLV